METMKMKAYGNINNRIILFGIILTVGILIFDLLLPLGVAGGVPYVAVILITFWASKYRITLIAGVVCSALVIIGYYYSPQGGILWVVYLNRAIALFGIWSAVLVIISYKTTFLKLQKSENIFKTLFQSVPEGIILSNESGQIVRVNNRLMEMFGYKPNEIIGRNISLIMPQRFQNQHKLKLGDYLKNPKEKHFGFKSNLMGLHKDGSEFSVTVGVNYLEIDDKIFLMGFISDITQQRKYEKEIQQMNLILENKVKARTEELAQAINELQDTNSNLTLEVKKRKIAEKHAIKLLEREKELHVMKSRFVSIASHEFRTPLSAVLTSAYLISMYKDSSQLEKRNKHIETIRESVHYLTGILENFLSLDKLESGKIWAVPTHFNITDMAEELIENMNNISKNGHQIVHIVKGKPEEVFLDKKLIQNILTNLLSNAIKYSSEDKKIEMQTHFNRDYILISVKDYGIGIPKNDQKHLFERFFRATNATNISGTGLGLNIIKKHLELLNGSISFTSKEGVGTTFIIKIPKRINHGSENFVDRR